MNVENERLPRPRKTIYSRYIKRTLDITLSGIAIVILSPLFLIIAILELIYHGRPILYLQKRTGLNEKIFTIYKFRSMTNAVDAYGNLLPGSQRITKFGRFLRRFSLDELPQLFCILIGEMSIIGPRPLLPEFLPYYTERHRIRHSVRPGLTCIPLKRLDSFSYNDQFENDIWYIENISFMTDVRMLFAVLFETIRGSRNSIDDTRELLMPDYWKKNSGMIRINEKDTDYR